LLSWIANIIIAFLLIYFIVYPGLGFLLQTTHPIVAVVSQSMEHNGDFETWWHSPAVCSKNTECSQGEWYSQLNITKEQFAAFPYLNGFNKGDIMVLKGKSPEDIKVGDILVFNNQRPDPIIHRIVKITQKNSIYTYQTKGDHNPRQLLDNTVDEYNVNYQNAVGYAKYKKASIAVLRIPYLGWIKILFVQYPIYFIVAFIIFILAASNYEAIKRMMGGK
jgi:hypothetical protein